MNRQRPCDTRREIMRDLKAVARQADKEGDSDTRNRAAAEWFRLANRTEARKAPRYLEAGRLI
ncbi:MAG: hypothetical protein U9Q81_22360 [Pseudomonadota bacterium]|nr:hypothetical protein [Pseudomonadota bacterium]